MRDEGSFVQKEDLEAVLKELYQNPSDDKLAYQYLPCPMFTHPQDCLGHFIMVTPFPATLTNLW
jgi:hypothetical protein